jgi:predicted  nucleic acid-binding Zn-ribbon protein
MDAYEFKKLQVEYKRVNAAREEQELRILEFQDQIKRLEASIAISLAREDELQAKLSEMKKQG